VFPSGAQRFPSYRGEARTAFLSREAKTACLPTRKNMKDLEAIERVISAGGSEKET